MTSRHVGVVLPDNFPQKTIVYYSCPLVGMSTPGRPCQIQRGKSCVAYQMIRHPFSANVVSRIVGAGHNVVDVEVTHDHAVEEVQVEIPGNSEWRTTLSLLPECNCNWRQNSHTVLPERLTVLPESFSKKLPNFRKTQKTYIKAILKTQNIYIKALSKGKNIYIKAQRNRAITIFKLVYGNTAN